MIVLMGMRELETGGIRRDIGLISMNESKLTETLVNAFSIEKSEFLQLEQKLQEYKGFFYEQHNVKASRKQILPIVQNILNNQL